MSDGWIIPTRIVGRVLRAGLDEIHQRIEADTFGELGNIIFHTLSAEERERAVEYLRRRARIIEGETPTINIPIRYFYPRTPAEVPCYAIVIDPERQQEFVGDVTGQTQYIGATVTEDGEGWESVAGIIVYASNAEELEWLYQIAKFTLARRKHELTDHFEMGVSVSGQDFGFEPRFLPNDFVYRRVLQVRCEYVQYNAAAYDLSEEIFGQAADVQVTEGPNA